MLLLLLLRTYFFSFDDVIGFCLGDRYTNSSSPSFSFIRFSLFGLSLLSLSLLSLSLSLSLFRYIYIFSVYIFCVIRAKCVLCRRLHEIQFCTRNQLVIKFEEKTV